MNLYIHAFFALSIMIMSFNCSLLYKIIASQNYVEWSGNDILYLLIHHSIDITDNFMIENNAAVVDLI